MSGLDRGPAPHRGLGSSYCEEEEEEEEGEEGAETEEHLIGGHVVDPPPRRQRLGRGRVGMVHQIGVFVFVVAFLFVAVFPTRTYLSQRRELAASSQRLAFLVEENRKLQAAAERLQRDDAIERLARERFGLVRPSEEAYAVFTQAPTANAVPMVPPAGSQRGDGRSGGFPPVMADPRGLNLPSLVKDVLERLF